MGPNKKVYWKNYLDSFVSILFTVLLIIFIGWILSFIPSELDKERIQNIYNMRVDLFVEERSERVQYMVLTVLFPVVYYFSFKIIRKVNFSFDTLKAGTTCYIISSIFMLLFFLFINNTNLFYFSNILSVNPIEYGILAIFLSTGLLYYQYNFCGKVNNIKKFVDFFILFTCILTSLLTAWLFLTNTYMFNDFMILHANAYFYPIYKVFSGQTILTDFNCLYGFYPYILEPIMKFIGGVDLRHLSIVMSAIILFICLCISYILWKLCNNKFWTLCGFIAVVFFVFIFHPMYTSHGIYYLQYVPHRILFPVLIAAISCCFNCTNNNLTTINKNKILYSQITAKKEQKIYKKIIGLFYNGKYTIKNSIIIVGFIISSLALFWNIETGIVVLLSWCLQLAYTSLLKWKFSQKELYRCILKIIGGAVGSVVLFYLSLGLVTFHRTGRWIRFSDILYGQITFYGSGFNMIRMPLIGHWILLVSVYAVALSISIRYIIFIHKFKDSQNTDINPAMYFTLSVIGMGIFVYYQGRSHYTNLVFISWPALIIIIMMIQQYFNKFKCLLFIENTHLSEKLAHIVKCIKNFMLIALILTFTLSYPLLFNQLGQALIKEKDVENDVALNAVNFINEVRNNNEPIDLVTQNSAVISSYMKEKLYAKIPDPVDWFTKSDYQKVLNWLDETDHNVLVDSWCSNAMRVYCNDEFTSIMQERFNIVKTNDKFTYYSLKE